MKIPYVILEFSDVTMCNQTFLFYVFFALKYSDSSTFHHFAG